MRLLPKVRKGFNKLGKLERLRSGVVRALTASVMATGLVLGAASLDKASAAIGGDPAISAESGGTIILTPGPNLGLVDGSSQLASHYSHVSHASHSSHTSHCSSYC